MAQRDQLVRALGGLDPRDPGDADDVALGGVAGCDELRRRRRDPHHGARDRAACGDVLVGDVDHLGPAFGVEVGEVAQAGW